MRFTENDVELLNWMARTDRNSSEWQEIRQASNEPLNDFSMIFRQGYFAANDWKRDDVSSIRHLILASAASPLTSIASPVRVNMLLMTHASSKQLRLTASVYTCFPTCRLYHVWLNAGRLKSFSHAFFAYAGLAESLEMMQSCDMSVKAMRVRE